MSNLSLITKSELQERRFASDEYKGFTVFARLERGGYSFSIGLLLEENSDACHWICSELSAVTITELKSEAKSIINSFEFTAKQLLDIDSVIELTNYGNINDEPKSVDQIIDEELERQSAAQDQQKQSEIRQIDKGMYRALMSSYRYARSLVLMLMRQYPEQHKTLAKRLSYINEQFDIKYLKPIGLDCYHPDSCHAWVINRVMNKMNLSSSKALELSEKLHVDVKQKTDYLSINNSKNNKNKSFYMQILEADL